MEDTAPYMKKTPTKILDNDIWVPANTHCHSDIKIWHFEFQYRAAIKRNKVHNILLFGSTFFPLPIQGHTALHRRVCHPIIPQHLNESPSINNFWEAKLENSDLVRTAQSSSVFNLMSICCIEIVSLFEGTGDSPGSFPF